MFSLAPCRPYKGPVDQKKYYVGFTIFSFICHLSVLRFVHWGMNYVSPLIYNGPCIYLAVYILELWWEYLNAAAVTHSVDSQFLRARSRPGLTLSVILPRLAVYSPSPKSGVHISALTIGYLAFDVGATPTPQYIWVLTISTACISSHSGFAGNCWDVS